MLLVAAAIFLSFKFYRKFYCKFYWTCDQSFSRSSRARLCNAQALEFQVSTERLYKFATSYLSIINETVQIPMVGLNIESIVSFPHNTSQTGEGTRVIGVSREGGPAGPSGPLMVLRRFCDRHQMMTRVSTAVTRIYKIGPEIWGPSPPPKKICRQRENGVANCNLSWACALNLVNFGSPMAKK